MILKWLRRQENLIEMLRLSGDVPTKEEIDQLAIFALQDGHSVQEARYVIQKRKESSNGARNTQGN